MWSVWGSIKGLFRPSLPALLPLLSRGERPPDKAVTVDYAAKWRRGEAERKQGRRGEEFVGT